MDPIDTSRERARPFWAWLRAHWARVAAGLALAAVGAAAGVVSYTHIDALTLALGGSPLAGHLMPLGVDGQIVMGSIVLLTATGRQAWWGWLGIGAGMAESLFANYESGIAHGYLAAGWAMVAALSFAVASFLLERWLKAQASLASQGGRPSARADDEGDDGKPSNPCSHQVAWSADEALVQAYLHARDCLGTPLSQRALSTSFGVSRPRVAELVGGRAPEPVAVGLNGASPDA